MPLVDRQIHGGKALVEALRDSGFDVTVSGWTKLYEDGWWLYIASQDVDDRGIRAAYGSVISAARANPEIGTDLIDDVKLIDREDPITKDLLAIRGTGISEVTKRSRQPRLGSMYVDDTYVYA